MGKENQMALFSIRVKKEEKLFLEDKSKELNLTMTEVIKYCIHKTLINPKMTIKEYRKRIF